MAKKVTGMIKLQLPAGKATPAPPVGPALGQHGVNIMGFCKEFNAKTANQAGLIIPVVITVYQDRSFSFILKTPPAAVLIKKELGLEIIGDTKVKIASVEEEDNWDILDDSEDNEIDKINTNYLNEEIIK